MKWCFRVFLFLCILLSTGICHHSFSLPGYGSNNYANSIEYPGLIKHFTYTSAKSINDIPVLQIIEHGEDEEDSSTSNIKKSSLYAICTFANFNSNTLNLIFQNRINKRYQNRHAALNSYQRCILLQTLRI